MRHRNIISGMVIFSLVMVLGAMNARADQITLSDTCTGNLTVQSGVPGAWGGSVSNCQGSFDSSTLGALIGDSKWSLNTSTGAFSFGDAGHTITGTMTLSSVLFSGSLALLQGSLNVTGITGGSPLSVYHVGGNYMWDMTLFGCSQSTDASPGPAAAVSATCSVSTGEIPVPEPGSLALFGSGLIGIASFVRRKITRS